MMRIGIISDSDCCIPLMGALVSQQVQVCLFHSPSTDEFNNQKVKAFTKQFHITLTEEKNRNDDLYNWVRKGMFEACFIIGYGRLIHLGRLKGISTELYNVHFGPLPAFRGPVPIFWQLRDGVKKLGLAIHRLNEHFDEGEILWLKQIPNLPHYNFKSVMQLFSQLCVEGSFFILQSLINKLPLITIDRTQITPSFQKRPLLKDASINWGEMKAEEICDLIRACNPWNRGAIALYQREEIKLMDARISINCVEPPGSIIKDENKLIIACSDSQSIEVSMLYYKESYLASYYFKQLYGGSRDIFHSGITK